MVGVEEERGTKASKCFSLAFLTGSQDMSMYVESPLLCVITPLRVDALEVPIMHKELLPLVVAHLPHPDRGLAR
jgi:hypothetical protein